MDPALIQQRQKFAKQMAASTESAMAAAKQARLAAAAAARQPQQQSYHQHASASVYRQPVGSSQQPQQQQQQAGVSQLHHHPGQGKKTNALYKVMRYMKTRHLDGMRHPLTLDEILEETNQEDLPPVVKVWLGHEALPQNPKLTVIPEGAVNKFIFKPCYQFRSGRSGVKDLLRLLRQFDQEGKGAMFKEDLEESISNVDDVLKQLGSRVTILTRMSDKKVTLFYNDSNFQLPTPVDEEFKKLWRSCTVQSLDEQQMQQYLNGQGISAADAHRDSGGFVPAGRAGRKGAGNKKQKPVRLKDNEHVNHVLEDFSEKLANKK